MNTSITQTFVHDRYSNIISTKKIFLQYFSRKCIFGTMCIAICLSCSNFPLHNSDLPIIKEFTYSVWLIITAIFKYINDMRIISLIFFLLFKVCFTMFPSKRELIQHQISSHGMDIPLDNISSNHTSPGATRPFPSSPASSRIYPTSPRGAPGRFPTSENSSANDAFMAPRPALDFENFVNTAKTSAENISFDAHSFESCSDDDTDAYEDQRFDHEALDLFGHSGNKWSDRQLSHKWSEGGPTSSKFSIGKANKWQDHSDSGFPPGLTHALSSARGKVLTDEERRRKLDTIVARVGGLGRSLSGPITQSRDDSDFGLNQSTMSRSGSNIAGSFIGRENSVNNLCQLLEQSSGKQTSFPGRSAMPKLEAYLSAASNLPLTNPTSSRKESLDESKKPLGSDGLDCLEALIRGSSPSVPNTSGENITKEPEVSDFEKTVKEAVDMMDSKLRNEIKTEQKDNKSTNTFIENILKEDDKDMKATENVKKQLEDLSPFTDTTSMIAKLSPILTETVNESTSSNSSKRNEEAPDVIEEKNNIKVEDTGLSFSSDMMAMPSLGLSEDSNSNSSCNLLKPAENMISIVTKNKSETFENSFKSSENVKSNPDIEEKSIKEEENTEIKIKQTTPPPDPEEKLENLQKNILPMHSPISSADEGKDCEEEIPIADTRDEKREATKDTRTVDTEAETEVLSDKDLEKPKSEVEKTEQKNGENKDHDEKKDQKEEQ